MIRCVVKKGDSFVGKNGKMTSSLDRAEVFFSKKEAKKEDGEVVPVFLFREKEYNTLVERINEWKEIIEKRTAQKSLYHIQYLCPVSEDKIYGLFSKEECDKKLAELLREEHNHAKYIELNPKNAPTIETTTGKIIKYYNNKYHETVVVIEYTITP